MPIFSASFAGFPVESAPPCFDGTHFFPHVLKIIHPIPYMEASGNKFFKELFLGHYKKQEREKTKTITNWRCRNGKQENNKICDGGIRGGCFIPGDRSGFGLWRRAALICSGDRAFRISLRPVIFDPAAGSRF
jgi:hypothetical protein